MLLASTSDLDDLIPTLVAYQIEWNKLHAALRASERPGDGGDPDPAACAEAFGGAEDDWIRVRDAWDGTLSDFLDEVHDRRLNLRIRMLGGSQVGYARVTRRWMAPIRAAMHEQGLADRPLYFVSSNTHSLVNLLTETARAREPEIVAHIDAHGPEYLREELERFREGRAEGSWENFLYYGARLYFESLPEEGQEWQRALRDRARRRHHPPLQPHRAARVGAGDGARPARPRRAGPAPGPDRRPAPEGLRAVIVNIEYPLGLAAYNILRELTEGSDMLRGAYVLGKAATLNADVGDVLISGVIHDEHSGSTYWLDNAFSFDDIAPFLIFGCGPGQPARGDGQEHVPAEPRLPRLLLPRGLHGGRDGGRAVLQRGLRGRRRRSLPGRRGGLLRQAPDRLRRHPLRL